MGTAADRARARGSGGCHEPEELSRHRGLRGLAGAGQGPYNGQAVEGAEELTRLVHETPVARQVKIGLWRNGAPVTVTATIGEAKGMAALSPGGAWATPNIHIPEMRMPRMVIPPIDIPQFQMTWQSRMLGILGEPLSQYPQLADFFGVKEGVLVKSVNKDSAAEKAGIKAGDVIVKIDDAKIVDTEGIRRALAQQNKTNFTVTVVRTKREMPLNVTVENNPTGRSIRAWVRTVNC
ncbi:MAG: PDZ domain-containing protein [Acidobacteriia bacterium]|nr:PDZ domain-containing protein [Terriglobia bacterium]